MRARRTVGIIGGMGPEATVDLMARVIRATPAEDDCDHIRMIVDNNPRIPSRIKALVQGTGESPVPCLLEMARGLEAYGADFLAVPCNTAHIYYDEIAGSVQVPVLHMILLTAGEVSSRVAGLGRAGLLASDAVVRTGLYEGPFQREGVEILYPSEDLQTDIMGAVRAVKAGLEGSQRKDALIAAASELVEKGAGALVIACTELSTISDALRDFQNVFDAADILAQEIVRMGSGRT